MAVFDLVANHVRDVGGAPCADVADVAAAGA